MISYTMGSFKITFHSPKLHKLKLFAIEPNCVGNVTFDKLVSSRLSKELFLLLHNSGMQFFFGLF